MTTVKSTNAPTDTRPTIRTDQATTQDTKVVVTGDGSERKAHILVKVPNPGWLKKLYDPSLFTVEELSDVYDSIRYIGFNRELMLFKLEALIPDQKIAAQVIIACALRGPQAASRLKMKNGRTITEMGIPGSGKMGTEDLSCQRIASSTADLAAFYLKQLNIPKRIGRLECPAWLQFPSAGSIKLPPDLRQQHREFSAEFSKVIGGIYRDDIYNMMESNSYLDENLHLFE